MSKRTTSRKSRPTTQSNAKIHQIVLTFLILGIITPIALGVYVYTATQNSPGGLIFIVLGPVLMLTEAAALIATGTYLAFRNRTHAKRSTVSFTLAAILVLSGVAILAYLGAMRMATEKARIEDERQSTLQLQESEREYREDYAFKPLTVEQAKKLLAECAVQGFYYPYKLDRDRQLEHPTYETAIRQTGVVAYYYKETPLRIHVSQEKLKDLKAAGHHALKACPGFSLYDGRDYLS